MVKFVMLNPPAVVYFDGTKDDMRGSINVTNMFIHEYIVFMVDSSFNEHGDKVIRCLPRSGIVRPSSFKTVELFTEIMNEEQMEEFNRTNYEVSVQWRLLPSAPPPLDSPRFLFNNTTSPIVTETVLCNVPELPKEVQPEYTEDELSLLGETVKDFNPRSSI